MFDELRQQLDARGILRAAVILPGDDVQPVEGALEIRALDGGFELATLDYGRAAPLARDDTEAGIARLLLEYVDRPLPAPRAMPLAEFEQLAAAAAGHYAELRERLAGGTLLITLPPQLALDRIGALDGVLLFPAGTSVEARALPPTALVDGAELYRFVTSGDVLVRADLVQPWFGQPGGALRFALAEDFRGIRDLVVAGALERIELA
ncbi:TNT domain-containing protein [Agromyces sp. SYSU K20354]|uniref:TNT domain-containing protein n=1 Tax=Agromyces cavernae TaxID=2898659 RepID=UPI001E3E8643|nr:TNT domain-containing protein [Agromyces cavernae]MCD2441635.1 TNT domain-containing protein [Agromyces cavernae]